MKSRRAIFAVILAIVLSSTAVPASAKPSPAVPPTPTNAPWPQLQGNAQHNGLSVFVGPGSAAVKWSYGDTSPMGYSNNTQPVIAADGTIYVQTSAGLYAVTPAGSVKWFLPNTPERTFLYDHTPALAQDGTIHTIATTPAGTVVVALDPTSQEIWRTGVSSAYTSFSYITISPTGMLLYANGSGITALSPSGALLWTNADGNYGIALSPDGSAGYAPSYGVATEIVKIDLLTGQTLWHGACASLPHAGWGMLTVGRDGTVFVPETTTVRAFTPDGVQRWVWNQDGSVQGQLGECIVAQAADGSLRVTTEFGTPNISRLVSINGSKGTTNWVFVGDQGTGSDGGCITVDAAGKSYFTASYNSAPSQSYVYCVDARGRKVWSWKPYNDCYWFSPAIGADGTAYYYNGWDEILYAFGKSK